MPVGSYGRQDIPISLGKEIHAAVDNTEHRPTAGVTFDWDTVTALAADTYHSIHGMTLPAGVKFLEYGTIICKITTTEVQTATISGSPTGGTFILNVTIDGVEYPTSAIPYNATAAQVQAALEAIEAVGPGNVAVARGGSAPNYVYTITWQRGLSNVAVTMTDTSSLTGGTTPDVAIATTTAANAKGGMYGVYDAGATDGRQTLTADECWIVDYSVVQSWPLNLPASDSNHPSVFNGGRAYKQRLKVGGTGQPSWANFRAAFPEVRLVEF
jgi:hypothetical protein